MKRSARSLEPKQPEYRMQMEILKETCGGGLFATVNIQIIYTQHRVNITKSPKSTWIASHSHTQKKRARSRYLK